MIVPAPTRPRYGQGLDEVDRRGRTALLEFVLADHIDRKGRVFGGPGDKRAGYDHFFDDTRFLGGGLAVHA